MRRSILNLSLALSLISLLLAVLSPAHKSSFTSLFHQLDSHFNTPLQMQQEVLLAETEGRLIYGERKSLDKAASPALNRTLP